MDKAIFALILKPAPVFREDSNINPFCRGNDKKGYYPRLNNYLYPPENLLDPEKAYILDRR